MIQKLIPYDSLTEFGCLMWIGNKLTESQDSYQALPLIPHQLFLELQQSKQW
jgi:hypothetical protein